jgi:ubiquinone/menaquinone biosynthesis C-methylase UbiE
MCESLPKYAPRLDALHQALRAEFELLVRAVPLASGGRVLDAGCGDGFFTSLFAGRDEPSEIVALDASTAYLAAARKRVALAGDAGRVRLVRGDVLRLPLSTCSVDVVWSAHSMQSYDDLPAVLGEFRRVVKAGGTLAILESDALHSILLPWPPRLELALKEAERIALSNRDDRMGAYFPRVALRLLREAGFGEVAVRPAYIYRQAPLDEAMRQYIRLYLEDIVRRTCPHLSSDLKLLAEAWLRDWTPEGRDAYFGSLQVLYCARAPR